MGLLMDAALLGAMAKMRPKAIGTYDKHTFGSVKVRENFVIFGGSCGSVNERKAMDALNRKIMLCHSRRHPAVILTSDLNWTRSIVNTLPDVIAFGINTAYQPFGCYGDSSVRKYMTEGIVRNYREASCPNNGYGRYGDVNSDYLAEFVTLIFTILERNYGAAGANYQYFRTLADRLFSSNGIAAFAQQLELHNCYVDIDVQQAFTRIWQHLPEIRTFWERLDDQLSPYTSTRTLQRTTNIYTALRNGRVVLFYVRSINSDILRSVIFRDISMVGSYPFPFCLIDHNVPLVQGEAPLIFAPHGENSVEFGMYFTTFAQFNSDITSISPVLDDLICLGARNAYDAQAIAEQFRVTVLRWTPHIHSKGIGFSQTQVSNIEANKLLAGKNGIPDGSAFVSNYNGEQYFHSFSFVT